MLCTNFLYDLLSLKNYINVASKSIKQKLLFGGMRWGGVDSHSSAAPQIGRNLCKPFVGENASDSNDDILFFALQYSEVPVP
jgi:hypothetical protein